MLFDAPFAVMAWPTTPSIRRPPPPLAALCRPPSASPPTHRVPALRTAPPLESAPLERPRAHMISFSLPLHYHLLSTARCLTMLPLSMLRFGKHLSLKLLPVDVPRNPYPTAIITLKNRTLSPLAQLFIACARETAKPLGKK